MILTITPNPALDLAGDVDDIIPNEKNYVVNEKRFPGGNGINAARVIAAVGVSVVASGFLGGAVGDEITNLLEKEGVACRFVRIEGSTRINVTVSNRSTSQQTRLSFSGPHVQRHEIDQLFHTVRDDATLSLLNIGGSFPPGFAIEDVRTLFQIAHAKGIGVVADIPSQHLHEVIAMKPILIKPNLKEFCELIGKNVATIAEVSAEARRLNKFVPLVCVSSVERGVVLTTPTGSWYAKGPQVTAKSSVGAGDSMVGGIMAQLSRSRVTTHEALSHVPHDVITEALRWGLASALATVITPGTELGNAEGIHGFLPSIVVSQ